MGSMAGGGWITEAEGKSRAMRQEGKVRAAPGMRGRGGELRSSRGYDVWRLENSRLAAPKEHGSEEWPGYLKSQRGSSANPGIRKGSVDKRGEKRSLLRAWSLSFCYLVLFALVRLTESSFTSMTY